MSSLFSDKINGKNLDSGYLNLREAQKPQERIIVLQLETMWKKFEKYADKGFRKKFACRPESHFWEMYLGCALLDSGKKLLPTGERSASGGWPDICVLEDGKRIWIEAIAPNEGDGTEGLISFSPDGQRMARVSPDREVQLRISSALLNKTTKIKKYRSEGVITKDEICLIAVGATNFGIYAGGTGIPLALSTVFPLGSPYFIFDKGSMVVKSSGYHQSLRMRRVNGEDIPRSAFLDPKFEQIGGLIWSRVTIGNMSRAQRPLTFIHNPSAIRPLAKLWGVWDREFIATKQDQSYSVVDVLNKSV